MPEWPDCAKLDVWRWRAVKRTHWDGPYFSSFIAKVMAEWPWRYRSQSKIIVHSTPHASGHLSQIWKEFIQNCTQDVPHFSCFIAKSKLNDLEDTGQGQRLLQATHFLPLVIICARQGKNSSRIVSVEDNGKMILLNDGSVDRDLLLALIDWPSNPKINHLVTFHNDDIKLNYSDNDNTLSLVLD